MCFVDYTVDEAADAICKGELLELPKDWTFGVRTLLVSCWNHLPEERPSFQEVKMNVEHIIETMDEIHATFSENSINVTPTNYSILKCK